MSTRGDGPGCHVTLARGPFSVVRHPVTTNMGRAGVHPVPFESSFSGLLRGMGFLGVRSGLHYLGRVKAEGATVSYYVCKLVT